MITMTEQEIEHLQHKIVSEHWLPVAEHFSLHIYESRWEIEGYIYTLYKAIGIDYITGVKEHLSG